MKKVHFEFMRYILASGIALVVDYASYLMLVEGQFLDLPQAAVVGYLSGLLVAYCLIANGVFSNGWLKEKKILEGVLFAISGVLGVALTYFTVLTITLLVGNRANLAKFVAVVISFIGVYLFRKLYVFKK